MRRRAWGYGNGVMGGGRRKKQPRLTLGRCRLMKDYSSGYLYRACEQGDARAVERLLGDARHQEEAGDASAAAGEGGKTTRDSRQGKLARMLSVRDEVYGYTPLHAAVRAGHPAVVQVALRYCSSEDIEVGRVAYCIHDGGVSCSVHACKYSYVRS